MKLFQRVARTLLLSAFLTSSFGTLEADAKNLSFAYEQGPTVGELWKVQTVQHQERKTLIARFEMQSSLNVNRQLLSNAAKRLCDEHGLDIALIASKSRQIAYTHLKIIFEWRVAEIPPALKKAMPDYIGPKHSSLFAFQQCNGRT